MSSTTEGQTCPVWAKLLMIASLTINLVVLGVILGLGIKDSQTVPSDWVMYIVPESKRDQAMALLDKHKEELRELRLAQRDLHDAIIETMTEEVYQASDMVPLLEEHRNLAVEQRRIRHSQFIEVTEILDHQERLSATERLQESFTRRIRIPQSSDR
ncbi:MAG: periplasmic heavy metal sensor [Pseudomonadota bacterium]